MCVYSAILPGTHFLWSGGTSGTPCGLSEYNRPAKTIQYTQFTQKMCLQAWERELFHLTGKTQSQTKLRTEEYGPNE